MYNRKQGLFSKAHQLSLLCEVDVFLCIIDKDKKKNAYIYSTSQDYHSLVNSLDECNIINFFTKSNMTELKADDDSIDIKPTRLYQFSNNLKEEVNTLEEKFESNINCHQSQSNNKSTTNTCSFKSSSVYSNNNCSCCNLSKRTNKSNKIISSKRIKPLDLNFLENTKTLQDISNSFRSKLSYKKEYNSNISKDKFIFPQLIQNEHNDTDNAENRKPSSNMIISQSIIESLSYNDLFKSESIKELPDIEYLKILMRKRFNHLFENTSLNSSPIEEYMRIDNNFKDYQSSNYKEYDYFSQRTKDKKED